VCINRGGFLNQGPNDRDQGWGSWGGSSKPPFQLGALGSAVSSPAWSGATLWNKFVWVYFWGGFKSPVFIHNTLFTCNRCAITRHDSFRPGLAQIAAGEARARLGWTELPLATPRFNYWCLDSLPCFHTVGEGRQECHAACKSMFQL